MLSDLMYRFRALIRHKTMEAEMDEELRAHLEQKVEKYVQSGVPVEEAKRRARLDLGGVEQVKEECRDSWGVRAINEIVQDIRYGLRQLRRNPGFTVVAVLTLALGIGVNTTLFTAFNAVALKPLPVREPESMVRLVRILAGGAVGDVQYAYSDPEYAYYRDRNRIFSGLVAVSWPQKVYAVLPKLDNGQSGSSDEAESIQGQIVSPNYFSVLGISVRVGRALLPDENQAPGSDPVIVLSYPFWQKRFNADSRILGKAVEINDTAFTVVGVAPPDFIGTANPPVVPDFWVPLSMQMQVLGRNDDLGRPPDCQVRPLGNCPALQLLARLAPETRISQAQAAITVLARQFEAAQAEPDRDKTLAVTLQHATYFGETNDIRFRAFIALLMVVDGMVLLVACSNLANMLLARSAGRQREIAVRLAMGAGRSRLVRQWLTESMLLALGGGLAGLLLSLSTTTLLRITVAPVVQGLLRIDPSVIRLSLDFRVLGYTLLVSIMSGIAFGLSPALQFSKPDLANALKDEGTALSNQVSRSRLRGFLVGAQMALSMLLLLSAGLLVRGLLRSRTADPGFETKTVFPLALSLSNDPAKANALASRVIERLTDLPAVQSVGLAFRPPWSGTWTPPVRLEATQALPRSLPWQVLANYVSPGYFPTLGIAILRGRNFSRDESDAGAPVAIVSDSAARQFWPGEDALGKKIQLDLNFRGKWEEFEVVGVAKDVRTANLSRIDPGYVYLPTDAAKLYRYSLLFRTQGDPRSALASVRVSLQGLDKRVFPPSKQFYSLEEGPMRLQKLIPQAIAYFSSSLGILALLLALVGIYGVMGFAVSQRTHEIGVRMAMGATRSDILRWIVRQGMRPVFFGAVVGVTCSLGVAILLRAVLVIPGSPDLLFGVNSFDPATFVGLFFFLAGVALLACYIPARRAANVDPMVALRYE
jgi:putative ABC transport system permease protein